MAGKLSLILLLLELRKVRIKKQAHPIFGVGQGFMLAHLICEMLPFRSSVYLVQVCEIISARYVRVTG